ncbi:MAG: DNA invertase Pin-like site-specific DNA recombinase [Arenicella sp.]|jgi:DNA invertase Pin-like site-specific DNA recombinase
MSIIGYARVSTQEQNLNLQIDALKKAGCDQIYRDDGISAVAEKRSGFEKALAALKPKDVFVIWKMDRAFRSVKNALDTLEALEQRGVEFRSITEEIETTTPMGRCMYQIRNVFAELERNIIRERTIAGMDAARRRGAKIGRPRKLTNAQVSRIQETRKKRPEQNLSEIATSLDVSPRTLSRAITRIKVESVV